MARSLRPRLSLLRAAFLVIGIAAATSAAPTETIAASFAPIPSQAGAAVPLAAVRLPAGHARAHVAAPHALYFAEGFTGHGPLVSFDESLTILNTSAITAYGHIAYYLSTGITNTVAITVPAQHSLVEDVGHDVGPDQQVGTEIVSDQPVQAVRTMRRFVGQQPLEPSIGVSTQSLSQVWYFAEGYTGATFQEYIEVLNPSATPAHLTLQPNTASGGPPIAPLSRTIPPGSRTTINLSALLPNRSLSLLVQSDIPICAERTLYWGKGPGSAKFGTAVNVGVTAPAAQWTFAYGSRGNGDQVYIAAMNPTALPAHVHLSLLNAGGLTGEDITTTVDPQSSATVPFTTTATASSQFAVVISSDIPIVCEEALYFGGTPNNGDHSGSVIPGAIQPMAHWLFPGLATGLFSTGTWYVLNNSTSDAHLTATVMNAADQPSQLHFRAAAGRVTAIDIGSIHDLYANSPSDWVSDVPVNMVLLARGGQPSLSLAIPALQSAT